MAFTDVFGGELLLPSQLSYNQITFSVDVTLQWSREQQIGGVNVVSDFMDMDATAGSLNVDMPSASQTGEGNKATFNNIGSNSFTVRDSTGGTIQSVAPGEQWVVVLTDNTTVAGTWSTFQLGASVSVASASALAGAGIKAISTTLNQKIDSDVEGATPFTAVDGDRAKCLIYTAGAGTCNLTAAATLGNDWWFMLRNSGSGTLNVLPASGFIDGASSINLDPGVSAFIFTDGSDWFTVGLSTGSVIAFDFVSIAVPGSGDFTLSGANLDRISYRFTGALTGNRKVVVPNTTQQYWVDNQTSGAFVLEVGTSAQVTPPQVAQGETVIFYCDSTDVVNAVSSTSISFPVLISQGGTAATTLGGAQTNLGIIPDTRELFAGSGMTGGGDLSNDRTFNVIGGAGITANADDIELDGASDLNVDHAAVDLLGGVGISGTGLGDLTADRTINAEVAGEALQGVVELATQAEVDTGTDTGRVITPATLAGTDVQPVVIGVRHTTAAAGQSAGTGSETKIQWQSTPDFENPSTWFVHGTSTTNFVVPENGTYEVCAAAFYSLANSDGTFSMLQIEIGGVRARMTASHVGLTSVGWANLVQTGPIELTTGQIVSIEHFTDDTDFELSTNNQTYITIRKVGP